MCSVSPSTTPPDKLILTLFTHEFNCHNHAFLVCFIDKTHVRVQLCIHRYLEVKSGKKSKKTAYFGRNEDFDSLTMAIMTRPWSWSSPRPYWDDHHQALIF